MSDATRVLLIGNDELTSVTARALRGAGAVVTNLRDPADREIRRVLTPDLRAGPDRRNHREGDGSPRRAGLMSRAAHPSKAEIERVCKGVKRRAGLDIRKVVVEGGRFEVLIGDGSNETDDENEVERLDKQELERRLNGKK